MPILQKKKVLLMITKSNWGGAQKHVFDIATSLPKEHFDVTVAYGGSGMLHEKLSQAGIRTISIGSLERDISLFKELRSLTTFFSIIKNEKPDIIHLHSPKAGGLGAFTARTLGVPHIIYTAHGWSFNEDRGRVWKALVYVFSWITVLLCDSVITIAQKEMDQARRFIVIGAHKKIVHIPLGIHPINFKTKEEARAFLRSRISKDTSDAVIVGTNAELHKNKGLEYAIRAMSSLASTFPKLVYIIIGEGEERKNMERLIAELSLSNTVFLPGYIEQAAQHMKAFDVFLLPSIKEGLPYVLLESGSAGVPCVATRVGGIPELITDNQSGILITPKSPEEIEKAVTALLSDPQKSAAYAQRLKETVDKEYTLSKMIASLVSLYTR